MSLVLTYGLASIGGWLAKWIYDLLRDQRIERKELREAILRPIRAELHNAIPEIESHERVTSVDLTRWGRIVAAGRNTDMPKDLRAALEELYLKELPEYDRAWLNSNEEIPKVMELADSNFGGARAGVNHPLPPWGRFLRQEPLIPDLIDWQGYEARIWNRKIEAAKLLPIGGSRANLLRRIWQEGASRRAFQAYKTARSSCLASTRSCLELLDASMRSSLTGRVLRSLHDQGWS